MKERREKGEKDEREIARARSRLHRESGSLATLARIQAQSIGLRVEEVRTGSSSSAARFFDVEFGEADHVSTTLSAEERRERPLSSFPGTSSKIRRRRRWGRKRRFIRETEVDGDAKARPLGVRFYLSRRGFLFHGKYPGHLGVRRSPIYGLLGRPRLPSPFLRAPFPAPLRSNCRPALPPFVFRSFPRLASSPEHLFSSSSR